MKLKLVSVDYTTEGSLVYYSIKWVNGKLMTKQQLLMVRLRLIKHNLKWDYREYERDNEDG
jgi:hypothetical protein